MKRFATTLALSATFAKADLMQDCEDLCDGAGCNFIPAACEIMGLDFSSRMLNGGNYLWDVYEVNSDGY